MKGSRTTKGWCSQHTDAVLELSPNEEHDFFIFLIKKTCMLKKTLKKCIRSPWNNRTRSSSTSSSTSRLGVANRTCGDIKEFPIAAGTVWKLLKNVQLNTVVVSSYHHHETYTGRSGGWLGSHRMDYGWIVEPSKSTPCRIKNSDKAGDKSCTSVWLIVHTHNWFMGLMCIRIEDKWQAFDISCKDMWMHFINMSAKKHIQWLWLHGLVHVMILIPVLIVFGIQCLQARRETGIFTSLHTW